MISEIGRLALLAGVDMWHTPPVDGVPAWRLTDGPVGARGHETTGGPRSACFPCGTALAATFDTDLVLRVGKELGRETAAKGAHLLLGPTVNLHRHPLAGRNFECYSEDPVLTGAIAAAYINGVQHEGVGACIKHFVCNDSEFERFSISSEVDEKVLRELYLRPFQIAVGQANPVAVMTAYNKLNGTFCSENEWLLSDVLRGEWEFSGVVVSDWFGTHSTAEALAAGLDLEMPGPSVHRGELLAKAIANGEVSQSAVDQSLDRLEQALRRTGAYEPQEPFVADSPAQRALAREAATSSIVLLKNEKEILPLVAPASIAVIGPCAASPTILGGGSALVSPYYSVTPLQALRNRFADVVVEHAPGCVISETLPLIDSSWVTADNGDRGVSLEVTIDGSVVAERHLSTAAFTNDAAPGRDWCATLRAQLHVPNDGLYDFTVTGANDHQVALDDRILDGPVELLSSVLYTLEVTVRPGDVELDWLLGRADLRCGQLLGDADFDEAVRLASRSDVAIVLVGTNADEESEGYDRASLDLPGRQSSLVRAVRAANPRTIVIVNSGSPIDLSWADDVPAVLMSWFLGQETGNAIADVVSGSCDAGGRLPTTLPKKIEDTPAFGSYPGSEGKVFYDEGLLIGYRWYQAKAVTPAFPFGHGLSYTSFDISPADGDLTDSGARISLTVANTGSRAGSTVVQVYLHGDESGGRPPLRLVGFGKLNLDADESSRLELNIDAELLAEWHADAGWRAPDAITLSIGFSSEDLPQMLELTR